VFWSLDAQLAYRRHFPAINWLTSYSLYIDTITDWFNTQVHSDWMALRSRIMRLLQDESELDEIVKLVGIDALSAPDRLKLEAARSIREDFLHQDAFHDVDTYSSLEKQHTMMKLVLDYYDAAVSALDRGIAIDALVKLPVRRENRPFQISAQ
jgi:V/A-type H+-transporting ATPase subunit A